MTEALAPKATAQQIRDAEHYIFSLGHTREEAVEHAARIGHIKVLAHQQAGQHPLREEEKAKG